MTKLVRSAWHIIAKRALADWLILSAALITVLLATALLAAGPIYADAVSLSGAQQTLKDAPVGEANIEVANSLRRDELAAAATLVADESARAVANTGAEIVLVASSEVYELASQQSAELTDIAVFRYFQAIDEHATMVEGAWPTGGGAIIESAISEQVAGQLRLGVGDRLTVTNRRDQAEPSFVRVSGIYQIDDPADPYWFADQVDIEGVRESVRFATHGPFVVELDTLLDRLTPRTTSMEWRVFPDYDELQVADLAGMGATVESLEERLNVGLVFGDPTFRVTTSIPRILATTERSLVVTRSGVLMLSVQLSILAGYALVLTAGLLVEIRRTETALMRSRGAGSTQLVTMAVMEGVLLTIPAAAISPWVARWALRALSNLGPLDIVDIGAGGGAIRQAYFLAFLAAVGCVVALAAPVARSARLGGEANPKRQRRGTKSMAQRAGVDLAIVALAGAAFWQLNTHGASITSAVRGRLGIDPLLIAAPALGLVAGAVLALRTIPLAASIGEWIAQRGRSTVAALAAWQVSRRSNRYSRSALLLIMAITIGFFASAYTSTWTQSQADQADFQTGADIRILPNHRVNASVADLQLEAAHIALDTVELSMPLARVSGELARSGGEGRFVLLDATKAADVVRIRDDLTTTDLTVLMDALAAGRPSLATIPLPGEPTSISLTFDASVEPLGAAYGVDRYSVVFGDPRGQSLPDYRLKPVARVVLQDRNDMLHRITLGRIPIDGEPHVLQAGLIHVAEDGQVLVPAYPLSLVDIEIVSPAPLAASRQATFALTGIQVEDSAGWREVDVALEPRVWAASMAPPVGMFESPSIKHAEDQSGAGLRLDITSGQSAGGFGAGLSPAFFSIRPHGTRLPDVFPVIVTERFLVEASSEVGDTIQRAGLRSRSDDIEIVGTLVDFPTVDPENGSAVILDLQTFQMMNYLVGSRIRQPDEYWLAVTPGSETAVADQMREQPFSSHTVFDRTEDANSLKNDPVALGTIGSLALGFVAAAVFAGVGFTVSAAVSARERLTEFGLMRALGLSQRQLASWLSIEQGALVIASLVIGTLIGMLLTTLILPLVAVTQQGAQALPDVLVVYPWASVARLEAAVLVVLLVIVTMLAVLLRRQGLGSLLRLGED